MNRVFFFPAGLLIVLTATLSAGSEQDNPASGLETLRNDQLAVSGRYDRFERLLHQMADLLGHEDPERAELLRRAISRGREQSISRQLSRIADDLAEGNLGRAVEEQEQVLDALGLLLKLLQSEDRRSELEKERERLNRLLRNVDQALSEQKSARAAARNAPAPSSAAPGQQRALDHVEQILKSIHRHDRSASAGSSSDADGGDTSETDSDRQDSESDSSASPSDSNSSPASPSEAKSSDTSGEEPSSDRSGSSTPGTEQIAQARQQMQEALKRLQEQQRDEALQEQDGAVQSLQEAIEQLRKLLRQLREEEKEMILASLEARFQRLLAGQTQIYDDTMDLAETPPDRWLDTMFAHSREMARRQTELHEDCRQLLELLHEDGTSVAIVLSVEDICTDMETVADRLRDAQVGPLTQDIEKDIIDALGELIAATQQEMQDMQSESNAEAPSGSAAEKPPLVQLIAEIKVLRSLQLRINRRTDRIDALLSDSEQRDPSDRRTLRDQLADLTVRQQRLAESAQELAERMASQTP